MSLTQQPVPDPSASAPSISSAPPRNVIYGTIVGVVSAVIVALLKQYLGDSSPDLLNAVLPAVPVLVGALVAYFVPMTVQDVADRTSNHSVILANATPANPTTAVVVPETQSDAQTVVDARNGLLPLSLVKQIKVPPAAKP